MSKIRLRPIVVSESADHIHRGSALLTSMGVEHVPMPAPLNTSYMALWGRVGVRTQQVLGRRIAEMLGSGEPG